MTTELNPIFTDSSNRYFLETGEMMVIDKKGLEFLPLEKIFYKGIHALGAVFMLFGGVVPYVFQYMEIVERKNAQGFSLHVCLALFIANILRILFRFGKVYEWVLLGQSIIMLLCMTCMLEVSVRMNRKYLPKSQRASVWRFEIVSHFWAWTDLSSYFLALAIFTVICSTVTAALINNDIYVEVLGMAALLVEATLGVPQFVRNCKRRTTKGMSVRMVLMWLVGDCAKLAYFFAFNQPAQFWICAILQITVDILILLQVRMYRKGPAVPHSATPPVQ